ncbi:helix-turn-helix domain-containing protein [Kinneretia asaccharophila]|uniref:AlpA family transcriptional regulator n=1 Tax=Roseateles asaccharophilus TaxID=582607 RepID=A0A4R6N2Q7_9BURK|nr:helix-turn-helix domain-containing protein [Roseateles asaccharophilus]MDN3544047.1 helix-turn-helix domain-containing protein [Roseateles asaccharophilus]TDP09358.1 AlpA family transcriptional regulator [Roseateles asaccharophilus]
MTASTAFKPMSKDDVADVLGVSLRTVENWVNDGTLPAPAKLGNRCYWLPSLFYSWLERRLGGGAPVAADVAPAVVAPAEAAPAQASRAPKAGPLPEAERTAKPKKQASKRAASVERMRAKDAAEIQALMA